jgi:uncharacterized tellurite resistance protein B-like protein
MNPLQRLLSLVGSGAEAPAGSKTSQQLALAALLTLAAQADGRVSPAEEKMRSRILAERGFVEPGEQARILEAAAQVLARQSDWQGYTQVLNAECQYPERLSVVEDMFRIAWSDQALEQTENETIRKIANLLWITHQDYIAAKLKTRPAER